LDGVAGVEAQTEKVWEQADRYSVPRIAFVNKLDRDGASLDFVVDDMQKCLNVVPLVVQLPGEPCAMSLTLADRVCILTFQRPSVGEESAFQNMVDLVSMELVTKISIVQPPSTHNA
jgi:elongation factor G